MQLAVIVTKSLLSYTFYFHGVYPLFSLGHGPPTRDPRPAGRM